jgi:SPOR domain
MRQNYTRVAVEFTNSTWADDAIYRLALLDYASGNLTSAARQLDRIRNDYPDSPLLAPASEWAARAFFEQKKVREGCTWLSLGLEHAGDDVELKNRLDYLNGRCAVQPQEPAPDTTTHAAPAPAARTGFGVQVGAVNTQAAADKLARDLKDAGFTPYVVKEGPLFKVRAGPYPDRARALQAAEQVRRKLNRSPFVVKEP